MSEAYVAQLMTAVDRQSKDPGSNPGIVESVTFSTEIFLISRKLIIAFHDIKIEIVYEDTCRESILSDTETCVLALANIIF